MADQLPLTSGSSDTTMEGPSRPAKMASLNFPHPQNLAALDHMGMSIPFPAGRHPADSYRPGRIENRLALWYHRNDGPWTPPGLTSPQGDIRTPALLGNLRTNPLIFSSHQYRESVVPSECDTVPPGVIPSDSGYGGSYGTKRSVANGSICDESLDRNPETQSLIGHIGELNFQSYNQDMIPKGGTNAETPWPQSQPPPPSPSSAFDHQVNAEGSRTCDICNKLLKTKSEFKKHKQRHEKPFKCNVKNCTRREGFSTPNDLDRHIRSLHPDETATGNRYRCHIGACRNKDKIWPRADNFRAHMKRVHQKEVTTDEDLDQYKFSPVAPSKGTSDLPRDGTASEFDRYNMFPIGNTSYASGNWKLPRNPVIDLSTETSPMEPPTHIQMEDVPLVNQSGDEHPLSVSNGVSTQEAHPERDNIPLEKQMEIPKSPSTRPSPTGDDAESVKLRQSKESGSCLYSEDPDAKLADIHPPSRYESKRSDECQDRPSSPSFESTSHSKQADELTKIGENAHGSLEPNDLEMELDLNNRDKVLKLVEKLQSSGVLGELGYKKDDPPELEPTKEEPASHTVSEQAHACSQCPKSFGRRCELKKHEKRHLKPYGCTFADCNKKFGSKNDWKRHENSQHYMLEHWRCNEKQTDSSSDVCGRVIYRREFFKQHLSTSHNIKDQATLEIKLETCRVGRNCEARFWCGFCQEIVEIKKKGIEAWTERFNHIDDHFHGRHNQTKMEISDWKNEYSHNPRPDSPDNDSEDSSITSLTAASSADSSNARGHTVLEKQRLPTTKQKRKREDRYDRYDESAKRVETMDRFFCCQCSEPMPLTSRQCTNYPCEHLLCVDCD
ncbi:hypothetical protein F5Y06DRAFT_39721 [Hypoxylon sp. FL0890]|nr:hypothetical protein F5Y06DRAFT_39721 [Hypoxylon sp. FL0890]